MNQQVKAGILAIRDFLAGRSNEAEPAAAEDKATRAEVAAELVAAMSGPSAGGETPAKPENLATDSPEVTAVEPSTEQEQERARQVFVDHGYFDEAAHNLRAANSPVERAAAARILGLVGSRRATAHLIAAMFDEDPEVRRAAEDAIRRIDDPTVSDLDAGAEVKQSELVQIAGEAPAVAADPLSGDAAKNAFQVPPGLRETPTDLEEATSATTSEEDQLLIEEQAISEKVAQIEQQVIEMTAAFKQLAEDARSRTEREAQLRAEAVARLSEEEDQRKRAEEAAAARRVEERGALRIEQVARAKMEAEAQRVADEETKLRLKAASLRLDAAEVARRRGDLETVRKEAAEAARQAEAMRERDEARLRHEAELQRLRDEELALRQAKDEVRLQQANLRTARERLTDEIERLKEEHAAAEAAQRDEAERLRTEAERRNSDAQEQLRSQVEDLRRAESEVAKRRAEIETAREKADAEAQRLGEAQARMRAGEVARAEAERERARLEAEISQQVEAQVQLLEETRRRGQEEQERVQEEIRLRAEKDQQRLNELALLKTRAEVESAQRAEKERQIRSEIDSLRIADAETRRRIEDAEVRRRATEDAYRLVAEKVQRTEAEAHAREKEEERMLAKLEAERRTVAIEAQSRAEQEKRIREEIEMYRRLEEQERPRLEEAALQVAAAEARLQERKERLREEEEARSLGDEGLNVASEAQDSLTRPLETISRDRGATETPVLEALPASEETTRVFAPPGSSVEGFQGVNETWGSSDTPVSPAIATYLNSVDPYKRAAAVAELARSGGPGAFGQIVECFDDHSPHVRNAAARALRKLEPNRIVDLLNRALEMAPEGRRRNIGAAIAASGLATEAIDNLVSENREDTYNALSILFVMAKTGEVQPLVQAIERHESVQVRMAAIKLLTLTGQAELANGAAKRRLEGRAPEIDHWS